MKNIYVKDLRSQKVQEMIDNIPYSLIRWGYLILLFIIITVFSLACYIKYPYEVTTTVKFEKKDNDFIGLVLIPKKDMSKVKRGQNVEIYLENVNKLVFKSNLCEISKKHTINDDIRFYKAEICKIESLSIIKETEGIAVIITNKISFFERIVSVFESM